MIDDGFNTTVVLDCGCEMRVNVDDLRGYNVGDWFGCQRHSEMYGYDPNYGDPLVERDKRVTEVRREE